MTAQKFEYAILVSRILILHRPRNHTFLTLPTDALSRTEVQISMARLRFPLPQLVPGLNIRGTRFKSLEYRGPCSQDLLVESTGIEFAL